MTSMFESTAKTQVWKAAHLILDHDWTRLHFELATNLKDLMLQMLLKWNFKMNLYSM